RYRIQRVSDKDLKKDMRQLLNRELEFCHETEKALVFCRSRGECDSWARQFNCGVYYSDSKEKAETLRNWQGGFLFATGALGAEVDIKSIKSVIHLGVPISIIPSLYPLVTNKIRGAGAQNHVGPICAPKFAV